MNKRNFLILSTSSIFIVGVIFLVYLFSATLSPSEKTKSAYPDIDLTKIKPNTYEIYKHPINGSYQGYIWHILIYKKINNEIRAWDIPIRDNTVGMPDIHWWRPFFNCKDFGPTIIKGKVDETKPIMCHDKNTPPWWKNKWRWDINGKNIGNHVDDLDNTKGFIEGDYFKFFKSS